MVVHSFNPSLQGVEAGGSLQVQAQSTRWVLGQLGLHSGTTSQKLNNINLYIQLKIRKVSIIIPLFKEHILWFRIMRREKYISSHFSPFSSIKLLRGKEQLHLYVYSFTHKFNSVSRTHCAMTLSTRNGISLHCSATHYTKDLSGVTPPRTEQIQR